MARLARALDAITKKCHPMMCAPNKNVLAMASGRAGSGQALGLQRAREGV
jgi:hypothetical protein